MAFADGQGFAFEGNEGDGGNEVDILDVWFQCMRQVMARAFKGVTPGSAVWFGHLKNTSAPGAAKAKHDEIRKSHPIRVDAGFEGNPGVEGGAWRPSDGGDDGLVHLGFAAGTEDLPLHVHEFSDRLLVVTSGMGIFHYLPPAATMQELRAVVVEAGDAILFARGVIHTFTAPLCDLTLLSYHSPFIEFNDERQFKISDSLLRSQLEWRLAVVTTN